MQPVEWKEKWKQSALYRKLHSGQGLVIAAVAIAAAAILIYMLCGLSSCGQNEAESQSLTHRLTLTQSASQDGLGEILSGIKGAGQTDVLITYDKQGTLVGVVVVSEGAGRQEVVVALLRAVQTATGADLDQIEIFERK